MHQLLKSVLRITGACFGIITAVAIVAVIFNYNAVKRHLWIFAKQNIPHEYTDRFMRNHIIDDAGVIKERVRFEHYLGWIFEESDVDIRFMFVPSIKDQTIEELAVQTVADLRIGGDSREERGVLLLYDLENQRVRIEVGYGLEAYFTDAFVSYLIDDHVNVFFASDNMSMGLRFLIRMLHFNIREAILGNEFDPRVAEIIRNSPHLSGGAGSTDRIDGPKMTRIDSSSELAMQMKEEFLPQSTPDKAYEMYLRWLINGVFMPRVNMFTKQTQGMLAGFPMSTAYFHYILMREYGKESHFEIRGNLAIQYFTNDPLVCPHFFIKSEHGWQMDMRAEVNNIRRRVGGVYAWDYGGQKDIYTRAFKDQLVNIKGYIRLKGCDNRMLPVRGS